ncbi:hypothetical protein BGW42_003915 [Actinomortierella wolfii]|nr:hypothetical protein BGW42_003915 [Actinomortierella wolfii]
MDTTALSKLNIKTLRGYLQSYNISTKGMLEKQELIKAIQSHRPIPDRSEIYFRAHLPPDAAPGSTSFFDELFGSGSGAGSSTASSQRGRSSSSSSQANGDNGWSWDPDKFFSKLFGFDDASESSRSQDSGNYTQPRPSRGPEVRREHNSQQHYNPSPHTHPYPQPQPPPQSSFQQDRPYPPYPPYPTPDTQIPTGYPSMPSHHPHPRGASSTYPHGSNPFPGASLHTGPNTFNQGFYQTGPSSNTPNTNTNPSFVNPSEGTRPTETTNNARPSSHAQNMNGGTSAQSSETFTRTSRAYSSSAPSSSRPPTSQSPQQSSGTGGGRLTLEDIISSNVDLSTLSIKVIKSLLDSHSVTYVGVVEKSDLVERLKTLVDNTKADHGVRDPSPPPSAAPRAPQSLPEDPKPSSNREGDEKDNVKGGSGEHSSSSSSQGETSTTNSAPAQSNHYNEDEDMCKICYDAKLNCVMLNCGHLATCQPCGKLIMDGTRTCPICRQYVIRLLHVFRA